MKKVIKALVKTIVIIIIAAAILIAAYEIFMLTGPKGEVSAEVWDSKQGFDTNTIQALTKSNGQGYKILLLSDVQLSGHPWDDPKALKLVDELVAEIRPDLIMTDGDNAMGPFSDTVTKKFIEQMESYSIPWGVVMGNHDSEGRGDRAYFGNLYEAADYSLFRSGPSNLQGIGNYVVNIADEAGSPIYSLIMLDSNVKRKYDSGKTYYDYIYPEQIEWYGQVIGAQPGVPSMLIFHIPIPEYADAQAAWEAGGASVVSGFGENHEKVCAPLENTGLFDKVKELGSTTHIFCGHDHINSLSVEYEGVRLTYGLKTGPGSYSEDEMQGATLITITVGGEVQVEHIYR